MFILNYHTGIYTVTQNETSTTRASFLGNVQIFAKNEQQTVARKVRRKIATQQRKINCK